MRIIKKLVLYTTIIGAILFSILVVFGFLYQAEIVSSVKTEINKQLNAEIKVDKIELSFVTHFPLASVQLVNVTGFESKNFSTNPDTLFYFDQFSLLFDVVEVFRGKYVLNSINAANGFLHLEIDQNGEENYLIFKSDSADSSALFLDLKSVKLQDCEVGYTDKTSTNEYLFYFPKIIAKGTFTDEHISTALFGSTQVKSLVLGHTPYLSNELAQVDIGLEINPTTKGFSVTRGFITLRDAYKFDVKGKSLKDSYNFTFESKALDLAQVENLLPKKHTQFVENYVITGVADVFVEVDHTPSALHPRITGNYLFTKGVIKNKNSGITVKVLEANGTFDLGKLAAPSTAKITVKAFEMSTNEGFAKGRLLIRNVTHPEFKIEANGTLDLANVSKMLPENSAINMWGKASFTAQVQGVIQEVDTITPNDLKTMRLKAVAHFDEARILYASIPEVSALSADVELDENILALSNGKGSVANSETTASITLENWWKYIIDPSSSHLYVSGTVNTERFNLADWTSNKTSDSTVAVSFPQHLSVNARVLVADFTAAPFHATNLQALVAYKPQELRITQTKFNAFGGEVKLQTDVRRTKKGFLFTGRVESQKVALQHLLKDFENFNQEVVTSQQAKGDLYSDVTFSFRTAAGFKLNNSSVIMGGDVMVLHGELIENKMLYDIPAAIESNKIIGLFINLDAFEKRLHHIKFDTLQNHFSIAKSTLKIPQMKIKSSALNIQVKGAHSFENEMDYYINFNLKEVLTKKKELQDEYGYLSEDSLGSRMIYLHVYTKNGQLEIDLDKNGTKKNQGFKMKEEWSEAKKMLKEEWESISNDSMLNATPPPPTFEYEVDLGEFEADSTKTDTVKPKEADSSATGLGLLKKKKKKTKKKAKKSDFEDWDFEDDDY